MTIIRELRAFDTSDMRNLLFLERFLRKAASD
jgi:hypothetical protein